MKKRIIVFLLVAVLLTMCLCLCACNDKNKDLCKYYDTEIKVRIAKVDTSATDGELTMEKSFFDPIDFIYDVSTNEMHVRIPYDGIDRKIAFYQQKIVGIIRDTLNNKYYGNIWEKITEFSHRAYYTDINGNREELVATTEKSFPPESMYKNERCANWFSIVEKGTYEFHWEPLTFSYGNYKGNDREISFFLTIE